MLRAHRQAWAWQDEWFGLTMDQIRELEKETQQLLALKMKPNELDERSVTNEDGEEDEDDDGGDDEGEDEGEDDRQHERAAKGDKANNRVGTEAIGNRLIEPIESQKRKSRSNSQSTVLHTPGNSV
jgi:hypothetical protein